MAVRKNELRRVPLAEPLSPSSRLVGPCCPGGTNGANGANRRASPAGAGADSRSSAAAAIEILRAARAGGIAVIAVGTDLKLRAEQPPAPELLARLRAHKAVLLQVLTGHRCRECGETIDWRTPGAVAFADDAAAHLTCYERPRGASRGHGPQPYAARDPDRGPCVIAASMPSRAEDVDGPGCVPAKTGGATGEDADTATAWEVMDR
jgi:hypothetical protein